MSSITSMIVIQLLSLQEEMFAICHSGQLSRIQNHADSVQIRILQQLLADIYKSIHILKLVLSNFHVVSKHLGNSCWNHKFYPSPLRLFLKLKWSFNSSFLETPKGKWQIKPANLQAVLSSALRKHAQNS
ncbi:hypothetical protein KIL84_006491 [Mauremys mutica]|uniref:Uncharacterized protein n=1 Tax=Mauremys mutica TaxID=74926 RepID=A0A9D3X0V1_9SAUR|nr:hypothetical protein KIL84_006491 [Mauremys mutica]